MEFNSVSLFFLPILLFVLFLLYKWQKQISPPALKFPNLQVLEFPAKKSLKTKLKNFPNVAFFLSIASLLLAFIDPHYFTLKNENEINKPPQEGIAIYLIADESGSMMEMINAKLADGRYENMSKIDFLRQVTIPFVNERKNDLIGLIAFARGANVRTPLTLDHNSVTEEISSLNPSILQEDAGTAMGYAVFKTVNLILATKHFANDLIKTGKPAYEIKNAIIVLITDGVQNVNPEDVDDPFVSMDIKEAADYAKSNGVRLYIINVDPAILTSKFTPERNLMTRVTNDTGGHFYAVDSSNSLSDIYDAINKIEKNAIKEPPLSKEEQPALYKRISFYPFFIAMAMFFLFLGLVSETTFLKRVP